MRRKAWTFGIAAAGLVACTFGGVAVAAGGGSAVSTATTATTAAPALPPRETPLTGDVLAKVKAAAAAKTGGTVDFATTENDSSSSAAAYEAHVTKADGTHVTVILDSSYTVLSVETGGPRGFGRGPGGSGETDLTGDVAAKAKAAAVAKVGGTADRATTENDNSNTAAVYEVHVTKADGSHVRVILDASFAVLSVETGPPGPGPGGPGLGGWGGPPPPGSTGR